MNHILLQILRSYEKEILFPPLSLQRKDRNKGIHKKISALGLIKERTILFPTPNSLRCRCMHNSKAMRTHPPMKLTDARAHTHAHLTGIGKASHSHQPWLLSDPRVLLVNCEQTSLVPLLPLRTIYMEGTDSTKLTTYDKRKILFPKVGFKKKKQVVIFFTRQIFEPLDVNFVRNLDRRRVILSPCW